MQEILETLILDFHSRCRKGHLPQPIIRQTCLLGSEGKIDAVIGVRRSGKTCYVITGRESGVTRLENGKLVIIPAWQLAIDARTILFPGTGIEDQRIPVPDF